MSERYDTEPYYLRQRTKLQPLSCRWPTWPHLISPAQHAMNLAFRQLPNLRSFIKTPSVHIAAARDPAMLGGPFVCLTENQIGAAQSLAKSITTDYSSLLRFAEDFRALGARLQASATGFGLEDYYKELPESLAGLVEMVYDLNNHPELRVNEEILYAGGLDNTCGDEICLRAIEDVERDFFMSTPMVDAPDRVFLKMRFDDPVIDELAALRTQPRSMREIAQLGSPYGCNLADFPAFWTQQPPERRSPGYDGSDVRIRYFGHACVLLQTSEVSILLDPLMAWERDNGQASLTFDDLPDFIDYVILTHSHQDHFSPETLLQLRRRIGKIIVPRNNPGCLADPSMKLILRRLGFSNVVAVDSLDTIEVPDGRILFLPFGGEHCALPITSKHCVAVQLKQRNVVFLVDSEGLDPAIYRRVRHLVGRLDAVFIGMECHGAPLTWLYGPLLGKAISRREDESRRLNATDCDRAWNIIQEFDSNRVIVYAMGQEYWLKSIMGLEYKADSIQIVESDKLLSRCREAGKRAERLKGCQEIAL